MGTISPAEIRHQLDQTLHSREFAGGGGSREKPKLAALLAYLVEEYLAGRSPDEHTVGMRVFGRSESWITQDDRIVSTNLRNLRESLHVYYETEGSNDPVHIQFPKGSGCRALVSYTRRSPADVAYRRGMHSIRSHAPQDLLNAIEQFKTAIGFAPEYAPAYAQIAEALCEMSWYIFDRRPVDLLNQAQQAADQAMALAPDAWDSQMAMGVLHICFRRWEAARKAFEAALIKDEIATRSHMWFYNFLDISGRFSEALKKSAIDAENAPDDVYYAQTHVFSLYFARQFENAEALCRESLRLDRYSFRGHGAMCLISIAEGKIKQALSHAVELHRLAEVDVFSGLMALCHAMLGNTIRAREILSQMEAQARSTYVTRFQLAVAYMGLSEYDEAVAMLSGACDDYDPWMMYLHLLPLFDPLRGGAQFQALLRQIGLPYAENGNSRHLGATSTSPFDIV
ncbi:MAG: hypothetical protein WBY44_03135 [Bryobacteraceae bacterium]